MSKRRRRWILVWIAAAVMAAAGCADLGDTGGGGSVVDPGTGTGGTQVDPGGGTSTGTGTGTGTVAANNGSYVDGPSSGNPGGESLGATPGGAQDIDYARTQIENGQVPPADSVTVEGLLSQHDLPASGPACEDLLCMRPAIGIAPSLETGEMEVWVQLGMMSGFTGSTFERPPMDTVIVIDKSSAMSIDMTETNAAVTSAIDKLTDDDKLAIVTFDDTVDVLQDAKSLADIDRAALKQKVENINASGSANMQAGLEKAYEIAGNMESGEDRMTRVIVLSCGYPDSSATGDGTFTQIVREGAADGIGLSFIGVLLPFDFNLADRLSQERGGNYYYLQDLNKVTTIFDDEFDYMVTPLAYDLKVGLDLQENNYEVEKLYGIPGDDGSGKPGFSVATAFISKRGGAMVARLKSKDGELPKDIAQVTFSYTPETAHGWTQSHDQTDGLAHPGDVSKGYFDSDGVRKTVALAQTADRMIAALETFHGGDAQKAVTTLTETRDYLKTEAQELDDDALRDEVDLVEKLIGNMQP